MTRDEETDAAQLTHWEGEPVRVWEALWQVPLFEAWSHLGSTNDRGRELAAAGPLPFATVVAEAQLSGRGRMGRRWHAAGGVGLLMTVLLRVRAAEARRLAPLLVGLAVCRTLEREAGLPALLKWPNDVLVDHRKVAGVLCEGAGGDAVVAGIGLNVRQRPEDFPPELRGRAGSVEMAAGRSLARSVLAGGLLAEMRELLARPPLRLDGALADDLAARDALRGVRVQVEGAGSGVALGIDAEGRLRLQIGQERRSVAAGSVTVLSPANTTPEEPEAEERDGAGRRRR